MWLPRWQRDELVNLCLDRGMSRREAASYRHVSVSTVQYWVDRYRKASEAERADGGWRGVRSCIRSDAIRVAAG
jgi:transposase